MPYLSLHDYKKNPKNCFSELATTAPVFVTRLEDQTVREGQALSLECQVSEADTVTWYKDGVLQRNNADFKQTFDGTRAKLDMMEVFLDDDGTYTCSVTNSFGDSKCSCQITVKGRNMKTGKLLFSRLLSILAKWSEIDMQFCFLCPGIE